MCGVNANANVSKFTYPMWMQGKWDTQAQCKYFSKMADDDKAFLLQSLLQYVLSFVFVYRALRKNFTCTLFTKLFKRHCIPTSMSLLYMSTFFHKTYCLLSPLLWPHLSKQDLSLICLSILGNFCQNKFYFWNKRRKFLKKLSCYIGGRV